MRRCLEKHCPNSADRIPGRFVFASLASIALDAASVRRAFRPIIETAGLEPTVWTPRELRHSFVSLLSASGMRIEDLADLCGHSSTTVTEGVYRRQLRPVLLDGAVAMDRIFATDNTTPDEE